MKKILLCVLLFPLFAYGEAIEVNKPLLCFEPKEFIKAMSETKESPIFTEKNNMTNKTEVALFQDKDSGEWTLIEFTKDMICLLAVGKTGQKL